MIDKPLISVIFPYFNENYKQIKRSLNSILSQTYTNFEIIIINDGRKKENFIFPSDNKIKYFEFTKNKGLAHALNFGISKSKGKYIVRQDADDISLPNRIELLTKTIMMNPDIDILGSSCFIIDENDNLHGVRNLSNIHKDLITNRWRDIPMIHPTWIFNKNLFKKGIKYENYKRGQDQYLLITNFNKLNYYVIFEPLIYYSVRNLSMRLKFMGRRTVFLA
jgi:glycosyltransferase involved in cell wall biosynthesis